VALKVMPAVPAPKEPSVYLLVKLGQRAQAWFLAEVFAYAATKREVIFGSKRI